MGPLLGPLKPAAFLKPMGPGVIVPPLSVALYTTHIKKESKTKHTSNEASYVSKYLQMQETLTLFNYIVAQFTRIYIFNQRWSPRGHILKSLASKPQVLENCPALGSRTALFLNR